MDSALHKEEATLAEIDARVKTEVIPFIEDIKSFHRTDKIEDRIPEHNNELVFYSNMLKALFLLILIFLFVSFWFCLSIVHHDYSLRYRIYSSGYELDRW